MKWPLRSKKRSPQRVAGNKTATASPQAVQGLWRPKHPIQTALIFVAVVAACTWIIHSGGPPLGYTINYPSPRTVVALTPFEVEDPELTEQLRENARRGVMNRYRRDPDIARQNEQSLDDALNRLLAAERLDDVNQLIGGQPLPLTESQWNDMRQRAGSIRSGVRNILTWAHRGIMSSGDLRRERLRANDSGALILLARGDGPFQTVNCDESILGLDRARNQMAREFRMVLPVDAEEAAERLASHLAAVLKPDLAYLAEETGRLKDAAAEVIATQYRGYKAGSIIALQGQPVDEPLFRTLQEHRRALEEKITPGEHVKRSAGTSALVALLLFVASLFLWNETPRVFNSPSRLFFLALGLFGMVALAKLFVSIEERYAILLPLYWYPFALGPMVLAIAYTRRFALIFAAMQAFLAAMVFGERLDIVVPLLTGAAAGIYFTRDLRRRSRMAEAGLACGAAQCLAVWCIAFSAGLPDAFRTLTYSGSAFGNGLAIGLVVSGILPFVEKRFHVLTGVRLLEIADLNQPFLKTFALSAPGTYNHSISVGTLAEAAAEAIGADGLLARAGGLFHDIGKINKPQYFIENLNHSGSPHEGLSPSMSALIIKAHPKDGLEIARMLDLPGPICDIIEEHHGTTLVAFFYQAAVERAGEDDAPKEADFRYAGRRPQTRESAIVMLADAVESATRTLDDPTPARIAHLVDRLAESRLRDGQFDHCPITLLELANVRKSLTKGLVAIYHSRIKYAKD